MIAFVFFALIVSLVSAAETSSVRVSLINQDPDPVQQGNVVELKFRVENLGAETLNDVQVEILPKYPFSLYSGDASVNIGKLKSSESGADAAIISYKLRADEKSAKGDNEIELRVKVGPSAWLYYTKNEFLVRVSSINASDIKLYLRDSTITRANIRGTVNFGLANTNSGDASFVQMTLLPSDDYEILSPSNYFYIGDMASDDTESQEVELFVKGEGKEKIILPIKLQYKDPDDMKYEKTFDVELRLYDSAELKKFGFVKTSSMASISVVLLLVLIALIWWYRRRKKRK